MSQTPEEWFEEMILEGVIEFAGLDPDTGEMLYNFNKDLEDINPEIFEKMTRSMEEDIYKLWEKGFLSMNIEDVNPLVQITGKSLDKEAIDKELTYQEKTSLEIIMMYMSKGKE